MKKIIANSIVYACVSMPPERGSHCFLFLLTHDDDANKNNTELIKAYLFIIMLYLKHLS
jgi:hypothetical protein